MAIPRKTRGTGGFLNNVAGTILDYSLEQKNGVASGGPNKGEPFKKFSAKLTIQPDGAEPKTQFLDGGFLDGDLEVSEDGQSIEGTDTFLIDDRTEFGMFLISLVEGEGTKLAEDDMGDWRSYAVLRGLRIEFKRVRNEAETKRRGKRKDEATGKEYDRDNLLAGNVLGRVEVKGAAKKGVSKATTAASKKAATVDNDAADQAIVAILTGVDGNSIGRNALGGALLQYAMKNKLATETRDALRKVLGSEEYQTGAAERGIIAIDGEGKSASLVLAAA